LAVILTFCTFGIFGLYWAFKAGEKLDMVNPKPGRTAGNNGGILYLLLYIFGGGVIVYALIQNELNNMADN
jgi:membrane protease YdiL (CAAX protease family)